MMTSFCAPNLFGLHKNYRIVFNKFNGNNQSRSSSGSKISILYKREGKMLFG